MLEPLAFHPSRKIHGIERVLFTVVPIENYIRTYQNYVFPPPFNTSLVT